MGIEQTKITTIMEWWQNLQQYPLEWEELRNCRDLFQVSSTFGFKMLRNRLLGEKKNFDVQITTLCVLLSNVQSVDSQENLFLQFAKALDKGAPEEKLRILEIPFLVDRKDLLYPFTQAILLLDHKINLPELIQVLFDWDQSIRDNFKQEFYKKDLGISKV